MSQLESRAIAHEPRLIDQVFDELCRDEKYEYMKLEMSKEGVIEMMTPAGNESGGANAEITRQLGNWWHTHRSGRVFDSNTAFVLPDGSKRGPDAAYITAERLAGVSLKGFGEVCPSFVIELLSQTDSLPKALDRMRDFWMANGVELGWLIDPYEKRSYIYSSAGMARTEASELHGIGPVEGFTLDLTEVWRAYE